MQNISGEGDGEEGEAEGGSGVEKVAVVLLCVQTSDSRLIFCISATHQLGTSFPFFPEMRTDDTADAVMDN